MRRHPKDDFQKDIESIPPSQWEQVLPIGTFQELQIKKIDERPYSYVAWCRLKGSDFQDGVHIKSYKNSNSLRKNQIHQLLESDFDRLSYWHDKFQASDRFFVVKPLFVIPENHLIVTREVPGDNLMNTIVHYGAYFPSENRINELASFLQNTGGWLRYFQSLNPATDEKFSIDDLIEYLDVRLKILLDDKRRRFPQAFRMRILDYIEKERGDLSEEELVVAYCHGDFNLGNIIVEANKVTGLDFGKRIQSSFLLDISRIYHQLFLMQFKPQFRSGVIQKLQKALLDGFGKPDADGLMLFRFLLIRHTLTHLVGITRFWQKPLKERTYNYWVLCKELSLLASLLESHD